MKQVKCEYCNHKWITTSKNIIVTCSSCGKKTSNIEIKSKERKK